jgi:hypothetical protein
MVDVPFANLPEMFGQRAAEFGDNIYLLKKHLRQRHQLEGKQAL